MGSQRVRQNWPTCTKSEIFTSCHVFVFFVFWWEHLKSTLLVSFMIRYSAFNYGSRYPLDPQTSVIWNLFVLFDQLLPKHPTPQHLAITVLLSVFMSLFLFFKIFIYLAAPELSCRSCGTWFPDQGLNSNPQHRECMCIYTISSLSVHLPMDTEAASLPWENDSWTLIPLLLDLSSFL